MYISIYKYICRQGHETRIFTNTKNVSDTPLPSYLVSRGSLSLLTIVLALPHNTADHHTLVLNLPVYLDLPTTAIRSLGRNNDRLKWKNRNARALCSPNIVDR